MDKDGWYTTLSLPCEVSWGGKSVLAPPYKTSDLEIKGDLPPLMDTTNLIPKARIRLSDDWFVNASWIVYKIEVMLDADHDYM